LPDRPFSSTFPGRRTPLAAPRRSYPGFFGALFLILLRTAIGWHFTHEAWSKISPSRKDPAAFSAEGYLRASTGPLAPHFRAIVPDADALGRLDPASLKDKWAKDLDALANRYKFDDGQRTAAEASLHNTEAKADSWFRDPENVLKIRRYRERLERFRAQVEHAPPVLSFDRERAEETKKELEADRRGFVAEIDGWGGTLRDSWAKLATAEQVAAANPRTASWTRLDWINLATKYGLLAVGICLMLGLFTPAAALGAAGYLLMFYLSMPPWPGLPESPMSEGHYLYVNKNLVEMLACLVLASTPNGLWLGLDALLFGWIGRGRDAQESATAAADLLDRPVRNFRSL